MIDTRISRTMVLGLGNLVHSDDGLGVHAIRALQLDSRVPHGVILLDGGTQGLGLLHHISGVQRILVIDAIDVGKPCGTVLRFEGNALQGLPGKASVHRAGGWGGGPVRSLAGNRSVTERSDSVV